MLSRDGAANTWTVKSCPQSIFVRGIVLFDHFVRSTRRMDTTPLLIRQNINSGLLCSLDTKQNELWWSDTTNLHRRCQWHSVTVMHINVVPDNASRISDAPVIHQQVGRQMEDRRQRQRERCAQCVGVKHPRCCWLRWWMWHSQRWCERGDEIPEAMEAAVVLC
jgi:hypothetical protein